MGKYVVITDQKGKLSKHYLELNDTPSKYDTIAIELYNKTHVLEVIRIEHQEHSTAIIYCKDYIVSRVVCDEYSGLLRELKECYKTTGLSHFEDAYNAIQELQCKINSIEKANNWISVKDEVPENDEYYFRL